MDVAVAKELLRNTIAASRELGRNEDRIPTWESMLAKMPDYMIDDRGIIKEWLTPRLENNDNHRHCSQLYPLFDGIPEEIARSPELRAAFRKSIEYKLDKHWKNNQRGFMSFGLVQLGQAAASLGESELAYHCLRHLVNRFWLNNLASMHNHRSLFNMDISGGMPAVIIKMLVASQPGEVTLLPALPKAWPAGSVAGLRARGAFVLESMQWKDGKLVRTGQVHAAEMLGGQRVGSALVERRVHQKLRLGRVAHEAHLDEDARHQRVGDDREVLAGAKVRGDLGGGGVGVDVEPLVGAAQLGRGDRIVGVDHSCSLLEDAVMQRSISVDRRSGRGHPADARGELLRRQQHPGQQRIFRRRCHRTIDDEIDTFRVRWLELVLQRRRPLLPP